MNLKVPKNNALVLIKSRWKETFETESGMKLYRETHRHERRYENAETTGEVVALPSGFNDKITKCRNPRVDSMFIGSVPTKQQMMPFTSLEGTLDPMRVGSKVHFSYSAVFELDEGGLGTDSKQSVMMLSQFPFMAPHIKEPGAHEIISIPVDNIFAVEEEGQLIAIGGKALIEPIEEEEEKQLSETIYIPPDLRKKKALNMGRLIAASKPMKGLFGINAKPGDIVFYPRRIAEYFEFGPKKVEWVYLTEINAYAEA